jgi:tight adherence protein B
VKARASRSRGRLPRTVAVLGAWALVVAAPLVVGRPMLDPLPAAAAIAVGVSAAVRTRTQRRRADADHLSTALAEVIGALASDLAVGRSPAQALGGLADEAASDPNADSTRLRLARLLRPIAETARLGGSVPEALRAASTGDGCSALARVAAAWQLAESSGAPVATVLGRVGSAIRQHADHVRDVRAELAGPRASARLLAMLPVLGLLMGTGIGAHPVHVLLETTYGQLALCAGVALELAGLFWTDRIARRAEAR